MVKAYVLLILFDSTYYFYSLYKRTKIGIYIQSPVKMSTQPEAPASPSAGGAAVGAGIGLVYILPRTLS